MREIGGYIEFEHYHHEMLHDDGIKLNCGRSCLEYLIRAKCINKIWLPYFICDSIRRICQKCQVELGFYSVGEDLLPKKEGLDKWKSTDYLYLVNYYGQIEEAKVSDIRDQYENIILDNAQAYFDDAPEGIDTFYTCRKFFGVADGAILYTGVRLNQELPQDESFRRMRFLFGRYERGASEFYGEYVKNNEHFYTEHLKRMSRLTENLLHGINYSYVYDKRTENFKYLHNRLKRVNKLKLQEIKGAFAYPVWIEQGEKIRKKLIKEKIYVPTLWPNVLDEMPDNSLEFELAENVLPLPCDQRYGWKEMEKICEVLAL